MLSLTEFYETISSGRPDFPEVDYYFKDLSPRKGVADMMVFSVLCAGKLSWQKLMQAEGCLERELAYPHIALKVETPSSLQNLDDMEMQGLEQWIKRHAAKVRSLEQKLFCLGKIESCSKDKLYWYLPYSAYEILQKQENKWFATFWKEAGLSSIQVEILCGEASPERANKLAIGLKTIQEKALEAHRAPQHVACTTASLTKTGNKQFIYGRKPSSQLPLVKLSDISRETDRARFQGWVEDLEVQTLRSGKFLLKFILSSSHNALRCLIWLRDKDPESLISALKGTYVEISADISYNERFEQDFQATVRSIEKLASPQQVRQDNAPVKRVELHAHSKFSAKDACSNAVDIVRTAAAFGHEAVALTDHGVVQGFPEAAALARQLNADGQKINLILGMEGYLVEDGPTVFTAPDEEIEAACQSVAALLVTPAAGDAGEEKLLAYKVNLKTAESSFLLLDLASEDACSADTKVHEAARATLRKLTAFLKDAAVICQDGLKTFSKLRARGFRGEDTEAHIKFNPPFLDLKLLMSQAKDLGLEPASLDSCLLEARERFLKAEPWKDAEPDFIKAELQAWIDLFFSYKEVSGAQSWEELNKAYGHLNQEELKRRKAKRYHIIILAQTYLGLYHLYRLVSLSHLEYFYFKPRIPRSKLNYFRQGLVLGSACVAGEVFSQILANYQSAQSSYEQASAALNAPEWERLAQFYDYLEIQPLDNNYFLMQNPSSGIRSYEDLQNLNRLVLELGKRYHRPVCATCDAHFINPEDDIYRQIIMSDMGFEDSEQPAPLYIRTTEEMLAEFSYLGEEVAHKVVVDNTRAIARKIDFNLRPFPAGNYPPAIDSSDEELRQLAYSRALEMYGREGKLPPDIAERLEQELDAVVSNGYAVMYIIAHRMVQKSNEDGFIVGSRGSVGSSVLATFCGISEVNPLPPHYVCPHCHYYEVETSGTYGSGYDLPAKNCPECGTALRRDGQDIPFATFLGFSGNKQPDIDLNFSGIYQSRAHAYLEEMFGREFTYKAGTINSYADKQSLALVRNFCEQSGLDMGLNNMRQLAKGIQGVKVSTGQHPGGIVVLPSDREIYDFTPVQYPANKKDKGIITTHFDFHSLDETILKIDALGHDDPTMLKYLSDITGVEIRDIPIPDPQVMRLFRSTEAIGIPQEESSIGSATIGLPEVGTLLARSMIEETQPSTFYDLVQLSGLSHGTGVWAGNAQDLIRNNICTINDVIGCRDNIMTRLIYSGMEPLDAFYIMETVRKGRDLKPEQLNLMREHQLPEWYIESCKKIQYLFPKAHAAAYTISTQRIAYFKVYYPEAFYSVWFTVKGDDFSQETHLAPPNLISSRRKELLNNFNRLDQKQKKSFYILELVEEMQARNIQFLDLDIELSRASEFYSPAPGKIRPPLCIIEGISPSMADGIVAAREEGGAFQTVEDLQFRAGLGQAAVENLREAGVLSHLPESSQISFFELSSGVI